MISNSEELRVSNIKVEFVVDRVKSTPVVTVDRFCNTTITHAQSQTIFNIEVPVLNFNTISISLDGKTDDDTLVDHHGKIIADMIYKLNKIYIDDILIEIWALRDMAYFRPRYSDNQLNYMINNQMDIPKQIVNDTVYYTNGTWTINLDNFFILYNQQLISSLESVTGHWAKQGHLGLFTDSKLSELKNLINQLQ